MSLKYLSIDFTRPLVVALDYLPLLATNSEPTDQRPSHISTSDTASERVVIINRNPAVLPYITSAESKWAGLCHWISQGSISAKPVFPSKKGGNILFDLEESRENDQDAVIFVRVRGFGPIKVDLRVPRPSTGKVDSFSSREGDIHTRWMILRMPYGGSFATIVSQFNPDTQVVLQRYETLSCRLINSVRSESSAITFLPEPKVADPKTHTSIGQKVRSLLRWRNSDSKQSA